MTDEGDQKPRFDARKVTWAALLGHWHEVARASTTLPDDEAGGRAKDSVTHLITLQAVWFALRDLEGLPDDEVALGLTRAGVMIDRAEAGLRDIWAGEAMPEGVRGLIDEARGAYRAAADLLK